MIKTLCTFAALVTLASAALAADGGLAPQASDSIATILKRQVGQKVELRLENGTSIAGKVDLVGENIVFLTSLVGQEFYEAVVNLDDVSAVVTRSAKQ